MLQLLQVILILLGISISKVVHVMIQNHPPCFFANYTVDSTKKRARQLRYIEIDSYCKTMTSSVGTSEKLANYPYTHSPKPPLPPHPIAITFHIISVGVSKSKICYATKQTALDSTFQLLIIISSHGES